VLIGLESRNAAFTLACSEVTAPAIQTSSAASSVLRCDFADNAVYHAMSLLLCCKDHLHGGEP
jgi:hypothetical protein